MPKSTHKLYLYFLLLLLISGLSACSYQPDPEDVTGTYRVVLESPGGDLAFPLQVSAIDDTLTAYTVNGADTVRYNDVFLKGDSLIAGMDYYDAYLRTKVYMDGSLSGKWSRRAPGGGRSVLPLSAEKGISYRYPKTSPEGYPFEGTWNATFTEEDGTFPAEGHFVSEPGGILHGTFRKETGDYRFLEGVYTDSSFTLSTFDGAHAFLFRARLQPDSTLEGDFWSRDDYHATWTAKKGESNLRDPLQVLAEEAVGNKVSFAFPDVRGDTLTASDAQFEGKPMLIYLFGSWCPNCADEARMLRQLYEEQYRDTQLEIVGLAYEFTGDFNKDAQMVSRYGERFNIPWTLLVAGVNDKEKAADTLPFLDKIISYPTSIFVGRDKRIKAIHVGFNGPATGSAYFQEIRRFKKHINQILAS